MSSETSRRLEPTDGGSLTMTVLPAPISEAGPSEPPEPAVGVLRLRGGPVRRQRVMWSEGTVDNEGMGKKKSKICCIYHRPKAFDESSSESESGSEDDVPKRADGKDNKGGRHRRKTNGGGQVKDESSESEGGGGDGRARPSRLKRKTHKHSHDCDHSDEPKHDHSPKLNKYDYQPKPPATK